MIEVEECEDGLGRIKDREKVSEYFALWNRETLIKNIMKDSDKKANVYFKLGGTYRKATKQRQEIEQDIRDELEDLGVEQTDFRVKADGKVVKPKKKEQKIEDSYIR